MTDTLISNLLLDALPSREGKRLSSLLEPFALRFGETLFNSGDLIDDVYFPDSGIISLLSVVDARSSLEVGIVGREGMIGLPLFLGARVSRNKAIVQGSGTAQRMRAGDFVNECERPGKLPFVLRLFANSLIAQISQGAACFRYHAVEKRLARWLLMTADRMQAQEFRLTQEFLSHMLGVRREAVNRCAGQLQSRNLIEYSRGRIEIVNRKELEKASCSCYSIIRSEESDLLDGPR